MSFRLYDAFVPSCQQILSGMAGMIDKAEAHISEHGLDDAELIEAKLADDMWPLPYHVRSCWMHSAYALQQIPTGEFTPDFSSLPENWDAMRSLIADAQSGLADATPELFDDHADKTVGFVMGGKRLMDLTGANMLLSFNQPNFYFHATTFYDILRHKGVALSKRDYLGPMRLIG